MTLSATANGKAYTGQAVPLTDVTGSFWLFSTTNLEVGVKLLDGGPEVFVKVLDGTPLNGKYWVFFGSLTDQAYTIEVTDSATNVLKTYSSPGALCGNGDIGAF